MSLLDTASALASAVKKCFTTTASPEGNMKTYITVTNLDGQPVTILATDEQRHYADQAREVARRQQLKDEETARKAAENIVTGTQRKDN